MITISFGHFITIRKTSPLNMNKTIDINLIPFAWGLYDRCNALCNAPRTDTHERESNLGLVSCTMSWFEVWSSFHLHRYRKDANASMDALLVRLCIHFLNASNAREGYVSPRGIFVLYNHAFPLSLICTSASDLCSITAAHASSLIVVAFSFAFA